MANLNVHLDKDYEFKFKELKTILKCKTNEETQMKIIDLAQKQVQQQMIDNLKNKEILSLPE